MSSYVTELMGLAKRYKREEQDIFDVSDAAEVGTEIIAHLEECIAELEQKLVWAQSAADGRAEHPWKVRCDELEPQNKQLAQLVRAAPWVKTHAGSDWYKKAQKVIDMVEKDDE